MPFRVFDTANRTWIRMSSPLAIPADAILARNAPYCSYLGLTVRNGRSLAEEILAGFADDISSSITFKLGSAICKLIGVQSDLPSGFVVRSINGNRKSVLKQWQKHS